jgi:hypothetical protein
MFMNKNRWSGTGIDGAGTNCGKAFNVINITI